MAERTNIRVFAETDKVLLFSPSEDQEDTDITGWTIEFNVKHHYDDEEALITENAVIVSPLAGTFRVTLSKVNLTLDPDTYYFEAARVDTGQEEVIAFGDMVVAARTRVSA